MRSQFETYSGHCRSRLITGLALMIVLFAPVRSGGSYHSEGIVRR
jgi:hypothetical protein